MAKKKINDFPLIPAVELAAEGFSLIITLIWVKPVPLTDFHLKEDFFLLNHYPSNLIKQTVYL